MNIIDAKDLAVRFKNGAVSSRERYHYLLCSLCFFLFFSPFSYIFSSYFSSPKWGHVEFSTLPGQRWGLAMGYHSRGLLAAFLISSIIILGIIICYRSNKRGDNKEFIDRYICIGFPIRIRLGLILLSVMAVTVLLVRIFKTPGFGEDQLLIVVGSLSLLYLIFLGIFYWKLNSLIKIAAH